MLMSNSFHHKTSLNDLPVEILPRVALCLDLEDIFSLQQTSKKLRESINVPVVWRALAKTYSARHFLIYQPQPGGFDDLTDHELHKWIRKRLIFDRIWKAQTVQPRNRALTVDRVHTVKLVPGGRWLLVGSFAGFVWYYNLDSEEPERMALIQPSKDIEGSEGDISRIEIYIDQDTSGLHFYLAMSIEEYSSNTDTEDEWLHVWQIKIEDGDSLTAKWMTSVPTYGSSYSLAIGRHMVVRTRVQRGHPSVVEVYWWKRCSTTGLLRSHFLAPPHSHTTHLIGDDRILCADRGGGFNLYDIPEPEHIHIEKNREPHDNVPIPKPIWSYTLSAQGVHSSPLCHDGTTYRFTISTGDGIWGFTIPGTREHTPSIIQLSTFFNSQTRCVPGLYKAFALYNVARNGVRIGYGWESDDHGSATMTYSRGELQVAPLCSDIWQPAFDEGSGRLVYHRRDRVIILDFLGTEY